MKNITYIFSGKRKEHFLNDTIQAEEFYYGLTKFDLDEVNIKIIEFDKNNSFPSRLLYFFDRVMNKYINLPFYTSQLVNLKNYKKLYKSDELFLVNESVGCSALPMLILLKIFGKTNVSLFVMGLYSKKIKYNSLIKLHYFTIKTLIYFVDNVIFLGKGEMEQACLIHRKSLEKFTFIPFSIDTVFWTKDQEGRPEDNDKIVFVGNDSNRDFNLLKNLIKKMKDHNFIVVTSNKDILELDLPNLEVIQGLWGMSQISDEDLRKIYSTSKLSIIPLIESYQPSGQSVALQSMSMEIPVIITETSGFWSREDFVNNENIFFIEGNEVNIWVDKISLLSREDQLLKSVASNAKNIVKEKYGLHSFYNKLLNLMK